MSNSYQLPQVMWMSVDSIVTCLKKGFVKCTAIQRSAVLHCVVSCVGIHKAKSSGIEYISHQHISRSITVMEISSIAFMFTSVSFAFARSPTLLFHSS